MNQSSKQQNQSGFTIVELIVGMVLIGLVLIIITALIQLLIQMNDKTNDTVLTTSLAQNKVENLRSAGFNALGDDGLVVSFTDELPASIPLPRSAKYTITILAARPAEKIVDIDIEANSKHYLYRTVIGELGVGQY